MPLLRGLFMTSFLAEDFLFDSGLYGAESAGDLQRFEQDLHRPGLRGVPAKLEARAIGLTSAANLEFVESLGFYDQVLDLRRDRQR